MSERAVDITEQTSRALGRHFVTLSCMHTSKPEADEKALLFSGFVVEIKDIWLYVTAGHIIKEIRASMAAGGKFRFWRLGDQTAGKSKEFRNSGIPFDFDLEHWLEIENDEVGLDYATVVLRPLYVQQLMAGGVIAISQDAWGDYAMEHDRWVLVGVPSESLEHDGGSNLNARAVFVPLEPTETPIGAGAKANNQFYARLDRSSPSRVQDVGGMSGGPIFAIKRTSATVLKYKVIGVQSGWYPATRTITACPFSSFGEALTPVIEEAMRQIQSKDTDSDSVAPT